MQDVTKIYALSDSGVVRYIGKTIRALSHRLGQHISDARRGGKTYRDRWIRLVLAGGRRPKIELIELVEGNGSNKEKEWIAEYRSRGARMVNTTDGGDGGAGHIGALKGQKQPPEYVVKRTAANTGLKRSAEARANISAALKGKFTGRKCSKDHVANRAKAQTGLKRSDVTKARISAALKGKPKSPEHRAAISASKKKAHTA